MGRKADLLDRALKELKRADSIIEIVENSGRKDAIKDLRDLYECERGLYELIIEEAQAKMCACDMLIHLLESEEA